MLAFASISVGAISTNLSEIVLGSRMYSRTWNDRQSWGIYSCAPNDFHFHYGCVGINLLSQNCTYVHTVCVVPTEHIICATGSKHWRNRLCHHLVYGLMHNLSLQRIEVPGLLQKCVYSKETLRCSIGLKRSKLLRPDSGRPSGNS